MMKKTFFFSFFLFIAIEMVLTGCAHKLYSKANNTYKDSAAAFAKIIANPPVNLHPQEISYYDTAYLTTNFDLRKPNYVILHHTAQQNCQQTIRTFRLARTKVSAHYVVCKDGTVVHMLNDYLRAWQAGRSKWGSVIDMNSCSLGIEIDNDGETPFTDPQIKSLLSLLKYLKITYNIPTANFIGHADIAPTRKPDPNQYFPWEKLAQNGFGYWYGDTSIVSVPDNFDYKSALHIIGYDMSDSVAAFKAFRLHFEHVPQSSPLKTLDDRDKKIIYALLPKYY